MAAATHPHETVASTARALAPGVALCLVVALAALPLERIEAGLLGRAWVEKLVLAILIGALIRTAWKPPRAFQRGIDFSARPVLEVAIVLLGASLSGAVLAAAGPVLLLAIVAVVAVALAAGYALARLMGLSHRVAVLIACGNAICGNSAIAAVAPIVGARPQEVSVSISYTAVLAIAVVLVLPLLAAGLSLTETGAGVMAGLTVYAVPQVLAATAPIGPVAMEMGTVVKLARVLMLGPVCVGVALMARLSDASATQTPGRPRSLIPWFVIGFVAMAGLRAIGLIPEVALEPLQTATVFMTVVAMAGLGLETDLAAVARSGWRVALAVTLALVVLVGLAVAVVAGLNL